MNMESNNTQLKHLSFKWHQTTHNQSIWASSEIVRLFFSWKESVACCNGLLEQRKFKSHLYISRWGVWHALWFCNQTPARSTLISLCSSVENITSWMSSGHTGIGGDFSWRLQGNYNSRIVSLDAGMWGNIGWPLKKNRSLRYQSGPSDAVNWFIGIYVPCGAIPR